MKKSILISAAFAYCILLTAYCFPQGTAINSTGAEADNSAGLDVNFNDKGFLMPRLTTAERNNISGPANGLMIFNNDCGNINYYFGGSWYPLNNGVSNIPGAAGAISGSSTVCNGQGNVAFSVGTISGANDYLWYYSGSGASISGNTSSVTIDFSPAATSGILTVIGSNACGKGTASPNFGITVTAVIAGVSISANPPGNICPGTSVKFTATPVNGGSSPVYQWKVNGSDAGTDSTSCTYTPQNGDQVYCIMTSNAPCVSGSPATSNTITVTHYTVPSITGTTPGTRSGAGTVTLGASASSGAVNWYSSSTGGSSLWTGTSFTTPVICDTTVYYVDATENGCTSTPRASVTAYVTGKLFQIDNNCTLTDNLVSYWKMEGNSNDFYGTYNGTDNNMTYSTGNGKVNQGGGFNGSDGNINISPFSFAPVTGFSISLWVKINGATGNYQFFAGDNTANVRLGISPAFHPYINAGNRDDKEYMSYTFSTGQWYHYVLVAEITGGENYATIYINNQLVNTWNLGSYSYYALSQISIGTADVSGYNTNGSIDEAGMWLKALSTSEINDLYNSGNGQTME